MYSANVVRPTSALPRPRPSVAPELAGEQRQAPQEERSPVKEYTGHVKAFSQEKGFGFIICPALDKDVHFSKDVLHHGIHWMFGPNLAAMKGRSVAFVLRDGNSALGVRLIFGALDLTTDGDAAADGTYHGHVKLFIKDQGYGFIICPQVPSDVYFGRSVLPQELIEEHAKFGNSLTELRNRTVAFKLKLGKAGRPQAESIRLLGEPRIGTVQSYSGKKQGGMIRSPSLREPVHFQTRELPVEFQGKSMSGRMVWFDLDFRKGDAVNPVKVKAVRLLVRDKPAAQTEKDDADALQETSEQEGKTNTKQKRKAEEPLQDAGEEDEATKKLKAAENDVEVLAEVVVKDILQSLKSAEGWRLLKIIAEEFGYTIETIAMETGDPPDVRSFLEAHPEDFEFSEFRGEETVQLRGLYTGPVRNWDNASEQTAKEFAKLFRCVKDMAGKRFRQEERRRKGLEVSSGDEAYAIKLWEKLRQKGPHMFGDDELWDIGAARLPPAFQMKRLAFAADLSRKALIEACPEYAETILQPSKLTWHEDFSQIWPPPE